MLLSSFSFSLYKASFHVDPTQPTLGLANNLSISIKVTVHNLVPPSFSSIDLFWRQVRFLLYNYKIYVDSNQFVLNQKIFIKVVFPKLVFHL